VVHECCIVISVQTDLQSYVMTPTLPSSPLPQRNPEFVSGIISPKRCGSIAKWLEQCFFFTFLLEWNALEHLDCSWNLVQ